MENKELQIEDMCFIKSRLESKTTPRLRADSVGLKVTFLKKMEVLETLDRCCGVPISRYSVFEVFMTRRLAQNQEWTWSRVDMSLVRATLASVPEKTIHWLPTNDVTLQVPWINP